MINFFINSWLKSYRTGNEHLKLSNEKYYNENKKKEILLLLDTARIFIITETEEVKEIKNFEDDDVILSYIICNGDFLTYAYTKMSMRRNNYFSKLIDASGIIKDNKLKVRSMTRCFPYIAKARGLEIDYCPFFPIT